jgi:hypothetical protein
MEFSYDISADSYRGARRDAYVASTKKEKKMPQPSNSWKASKSLAINLFACRLLGRLRKNAFSKAFSQAISRLLDVSGFIRGFRLS